MSANLIVPHPLCEDAKILVEADVIERLKPFRQFNISSPESGGILMGYRRGNHLHIAAISSPQPGDRQHRFGFYRQARSHQRIALRHWKEEHQTMDYLGEWHTHPEVSPTPSSIDTGEWRRLCESRTMAMVFLILGTADTVWVGVGQERKFTGGITSFS